MHDIALPIILRQATNGPDRRPDRVIVPALLAQSAIASYSRCVKKLSTQLTIIVSSIDVRFCANIKLIKGMTKEIIQGSYFYSTFFMKYFHLYLVNDTDMKQIIQEITY